MQFSTIASLLLHTAIFAAFMYTIKHQPHFVLPKAYTVKLVAPVKTAQVQPSLGTPQTVQKPVEKEPPPVKEEPSKAKKYEMKEAPKPVPEPPKPVETSKAPVKPVNEEAHKVLPKPVKEVKKVPEPVAVKPDIKPEVTKKTPPVKEQPKEQPKDSSKDSAKDTTSVEDRISMLKSKKKLEQHAMLRSVVDLSKKDVKMGQSPTGASQSTSPSFGDAVNNEYSDIVGAHVRKRWAYPESAKKSLEAIVVFTIRQDGRIEGMKLEKSSGNSFFDRTAMSAVSKSIPMPQPPLDTYEVGIRFTQ
ncbi:TonB family protein [Candidatus Magnetominusculus xianensis]|uniref:TonB family protein n=1 Tax=Candidatus Magnetominusculus xianensis TaxID=1748249 RepID=UPI001A0BE79F|nr:TonB family protein [Candidatus Magnetominusculus xianensis]MBF0404235.1 TonB family protein [Nitrospirota bacterium]